MKKNLSGFYGKWIIKKEQKKQRTEIKFKFFEYFSKNKGTFMCCKLNFSSLEGF